MQTEHNEVSQARLDFRLKEYDALLDKIAHTRADVSKVETIYPLAIATIYAWTFTNPPEILSLWVAAMLLPVAIAALGITRLYARKRGMDLLEQYIREIEHDIYGDNPRLGWERRYAARKPLKWLTWVRAGLAIAILAGTIWIAWNAESTYAKWQRISVIEQAKMSQAMLD